MDDLVICVPIDDNDCEDVELKEQNTRITCISPEGHSVPQFHAARRDDHRQAR